MTNYSASLPANIDIAIVGADPQALTLVTHLLQKRKKMRDRFWVFDASGRWMKGIYPIQMIHNHHQSSFPLLLEAFYRRFFYDLPKKGRSQKAPRGRRKKYPS